MAGNGDGDGNGKGIQECFIDELVIFWRCCRDCLILHTSYELATGWQRHMFAIYLLANYLYFQDLAVPSAQTSQRWPVCWN
jgi:hypothetical protein